MKHFALITLSLGLAAAVSSDAVAQPQELNPTTNGTFQELGSPPAPIWCVPGKETWEFKTNPNATQILVYDHNTKHGLAVAGAMMVDPLGVTVADAMTFDMLLATQDWDVVVVDCPSSIPVTGWDALANFVVAGGRAVASYWDWDESLVPGVPAMCAAFEVSVASSFSLVGTTLYDSGTSGIFSGVTMPNSDWHDHWIDDGDIFTPIGSAIGLGHIGDPLAPTYLLGNYGRTIATHVLDETGDTWLADGSGARLWENMIREVLGNCPTHAAAEVIRAGAPPNPIALMRGATSAPVLGQTWDPFVSHDVFLPFAVVDIMAVTARGGNMPLPIGMLLVDFSTTPMMLSSEPGVPFQLPIPDDCTLSGVKLCTQAASVDIMLCVRLTNALDITLGNY